MPGRPANLDNSGSRGWPGCATVPGNYQCRAVLLI